MDKVSVIVPIHNAENYIKRCCDSILQQSYTELEVLLIDDGSSDNSPQMCDKIATVDSRVRVIHTLNQGVSEARNTGIKNASGDWLMFIDADDWIDKVTVEKIMQSVKHNNADLGIYSFVFEYQNEKVVHEAEKLECTMRQLLQTANQLKERDLVFCSVCNKIYRRSILEENGIFFEKGIKFGEDFIFNTQYYAQVEKLVTDNMVFYHYDCSVDNSGVKKLYSNYDDFILKMDEALYNLLMQYGVSDINFYLKFIMERWDYAFSVCIERSILLKEKIDYISKWASKISQEIWCCSLKTHNTLSKFGKHFMNAEQVSKRVIVKELILILINRRILFIKRILRKVLIR